MRPMRIFVNDDRHVMAKHSSVYPTQEELEAVQNMVSHTERALKAVSDWIDEQEKGNSELSEAENMDTPPDDESKEGAGEQKAEHMTRTLRGVMRVGLVAKGLLLKGDLDLELVLLCKEKPTTALLDKVADNLAIQLTTVTEDKYEILQSVDDAAIVIKNTKEPPLVLDHPSDLPCCQRRNGESISWRNAISQRPPGRSGQAEMPCCLGVPPTRQVVPGQSQWAEVMCHCHPCPKGLVYPSAHLGSSQRMASGAAV